jgi:hypothetical protein
MRKSILTYSASSEPSRHSTLDQVFHAILIHLLPPRGHVRASLLLRRHGSVMVRYYIACAIWLRRSHRHDIRFVSVIAEEIRGHSRAEVRGDYRDMNIVCLRLLQCR